MELERKNQIANDLAITIMNQCDLNKIKPNDLRYLILPLEEKIDAELKNNIFISFYEKDLEVLQDITMRIMNRLNELLKERNDLMGWDPNKIKSFKGEYFCAYPY